MLARTPRPARRPTVCVDGRKVRQPQRPAGPRWHQIKRCGHQGAVGARAASGIGAPSSKYRAASRASGVPASSHRYSRSCCTQLRLGPGGSVNPNRAATTALSDAGVAFVRTEPTPRSVPLVGGQKGCRSLRRGRTSRFRHRGSCRRRRLWAAHRSWSPSTRFSPMGLEMGEGRPRRARPGVCHGQGRRPASGHLPRVRQIRRGRGRPAAEDQILSPGRRRR